ncbi:MAG TPA: hypothetical protein PKE69_01520 [Pyrinomonadaceae bacterium]|nr:hypothetical protein [Pyrinomonadaceae bacterium]
MKYKTLFLTINLFLLLNLTALSQTISNGCKVIDESKPLLFISYEKLIEDKKKDNQKIQLKLNNNSTCTIVFLVPQGSVKIVDNGQFVDVIYEIPKIINGESVIIFPPGGDALDLAYLKEGRSIFFNVPFKYFKGNGGADLRVKFEYEWEKGKNKIFSGSSHDVIRNYIYFYSGLLPIELQKKL